MLSKWQKYTIEFIVAASVSIIFYDILAAWRGGSSATISEIISWSSTKYPIIAFAFGVLMGHFFWQNNT